MASKYGFASQLKELRFLFCQTSEHSAATRYATPFHDEHDSGPDGYAQEGDTVLGEHRLMHG